MQGRPSINASIHRRSSVHALSLPNHFHKAAGTVASQASDGRPPTNANARSPSPSPSPLWSIVCLCVHGWLWPTRPHHVSTALRLHNCQRTQRRSCSFVRSFVRSFVLSTTTTTTTTLVSRAGRELRVAWCGVRWRCGRLQH